MILEWLEPSFTVAKWMGKRRIEDLGLFSFWSRTEAELSLVCPTERLPKDAECREDGWVCFRVKEQMDFSLVGILAKISACLAEKQISIFAISTFDTDYIFIKEEKASLAQGALAEAGWHFANAAPRLS